MLRLDFYVQHLVRQNARELALASNEAVRFKFQDGTDRASAQPIDHMQVVQLVQEAAPPAAADELRRTRTTSFTHVTEGGVVVNVEVTTPSPQVWRVRVVPDDGGPGIEVVSAKPSRPDPAKVEPIAIKPEPARPAIAAPLAAGAAARAPLAPAVAAPAPVAPAPQAAPVTAGKEEKKYAVEDSGIKIDPVPGEPKLNHYLRMMIAVGASDLHLSSDVPPMVRRHGEMQFLFKRGAISDRELRELLFEIVPARNKAEFQENNDTDFAHTIEGLARFRMNYFMDRKGIGMVARQIPFTILSPEKLGIPPKVLDLCYLSKGLVLVTGPTGSGKSTTLATLIDVINERRSDHIITIEDPIEFVHPNKNCLVNQREVHVHTKGFKSALRAALREDPDIVLVGEMRDLETIAIAIETAETGHLVFGTLHTTSAPSTVDRIIDQFPADRQEQIRTMLSESIRGVVSQMLCKKKGGGRVAAYEIMIANSAVANLIREGKTFQLKSVMQTGKNLGMQTMNDHLIELVKTNVVEPEEAYMKSNDKLQIKEAFDKAGIRLNLP
ncbi:MAG: type IV pilus twitching motility protein PilT [Sandaracinus sp.]